MKQRYLNILHKLLDSNPFVIQRYVDNNVVDICEYRGLRQSEMTVGETS